MRRFVEHQRARLGCQCLKPPSTRTRGGWQKTLEDKLARVDTRYGQGAGERARPRHGNYLDAICESVFDEMTTRVANQRRTRITDQGETLTIDQPLNHLGRATLLVVSMKRCHPGVYSKGRQKPPTVSGVLGKNLVNPSESFQPPRRDIT